MGCGARLATGRTRTRQTEYVVVYRAVDGDVVVAVVGAANRGAAATVGLGRKANEVGEAAAQRGQALDLLARDGGGGTRAAGVDYRGPGCP